MSIPENRPLIQMQNVNKFFGDFQALKNVNLEVRKGERIVVCGPSGSGKSTMIRCINRLEEHTDGHIVIDGNTLTDKVKDINAVRREVGMVFQNFNLFPHMTIVKNLMIAQQLVRNTSKNDARETAMFYLERVKIPEQAQKYPIQLSGGQQQRVAIARALGRNIRLLDGYISTDASKYLARGWWRQGGANLLSLGRFLAGAEPEKLALNYRKHD